MNIKIKNFFISILVFSIVSLMFLLIKFGLSIFLSTILIISISLSLFYINFFIKINIYKLIVFLSLVVLIVVSIFSNIFHKYSPNTHLILTLMYIPTAYWVFIQKKDIVRRMSLLSLLIYYIFFIYSCIEIGFLPQHINIFFDGYSRNAVSTIASILQLFYSTSAYRANKKLPKITPILTFILAVMAYGRTGIALSLIILLFSLFKDISTQNKSDKTLVLFILILVIISLFQNMDFIMDYINHSTNFGAGLTSSARSIFITDYFNSIDIGTFVTGSDLSLIPSIAMFENNPHNVYILGHASFGIFYVVVIFCLLIYISYLTIFYKNTFVYFFFILVYLIKFATDTGGLFGPSDILFYYLVFSLVESKYLRFQKRAKLKGVNIC